MSSSQPFWRIWLVAIFLGGAAVWVVFPQLDPGGSYPDQQPGPGLTVDEFFNVQEGARLAFGCEAWMRGELTWKQVFGQHDDLGPDAPISYHNPDHPPLGRLWLGMWHRLVKRYRPPTDAVNSPVTACARMGSAAAFGLTVLIVTLTTGRWYGVFAGFSAGVALALMPRVFGHAHLASLETVTGLTYAAAVLCVASYWGRVLAPSAMTAILTGWVLGLALLTKIQAVFIPIPVALWALWRWRLRAVVPLLLWGGAAAAIFFAGWPWLWLDPVNHLREYLGRTTDRSTIYVFYLGERLTDKTVPWHYPWLMFGVTVPVGLHLLGLMGAGSRSDEDHRRNGWSPREWLLAMSVLFPLVMFSPPRVSVYDGVRLFLVVFPLWAVFIGRGAAALVETVAKRTNKPLAWLCVLALLIGQGYGVWKTTPMWLAYYNVSVGGTRGAESLGMELDYWGTGVTRAFQRKIVEVVPAGSKIHVVPLVHQFQLTDMLEQSPVLRQHGIQLAPAIEQEESGIKYLLVYFRRAEDWPERIRGKVDAKVLVESKVDGVRVAALYRWRGDE